jgi:uncharacterized protein YodC (DUF2158 family)
MNVSVICACKNRYDALRVSLNSWLAFNEIKEIIIVDWSSDTPINSLTKLDKRIKVVRVNDEKYFNQPQPLNLAASIATGDYILKLDCDYIINPYFSFFEAYAIDQNSFVCGQDSYECKHEYWDENLQGYAINFHNMDVGELMKYSHSYSPLFKYLTGLCFVSRQNYWKVGGYDERMGKYYAYEDDQMTKRLSMMGLECKKLNQDYNVIHIPHPDKKRYENFEGYGEEGESNIENVKRKIADPNTSDSDRWNLEYLLAKMNVEYNEQLFSDLDDYYISRIYDWEVMNIDDQNYIATRKEKVKKLSQLSTVYYVSLEESVGRRTKLEESLKEHGATNIKSIISKRFSECDDIVTGKYVDSLNDGTKGCCVSHLKAIKEWYDTTNEEYGFFCEDDLSLDTVDYWNFTWKEFVDNLPEDWGCVQMLPIRGEYSDIKIRERYWDDWSVTAYIIKRDHAKYIIDNYIVDGTYHLELKDAEVQPLIENILYTSAGKVYTIPMFVEDVGFTSTFEGDDGDVKEGQKRNHYYAHDYIINWWKDNGENKTIEELMGRTFEIKLVEEPVVENKTELLVDASTANLNDLLLDYALDTENPIKNFNIGMWYEHHRHNAPALSFFLRCAERTDDLDFAYEALIHASNAYDRQGTRDQTAKGLLQQALCIRPKRPEAYYLLARFAEKKEWWQECYIMCQWALEFCNFDCAPLRTDVEYPGEYGFLFQKSLASWSWGKGNETRELLIDLKNNYELDSNHRILVRNNLIKVGSGDILEEDCVYDQNKKSIFKYQFENMDRIELNYSQLFQDMFILSVLNGKENGTYLQIGYNDPINKNNTTLLETKYNWYGVSICENDELNTRFSQERRNSYHCGEVELINYSDVLKDMNKGDTIDYLQIDAGNSKKSFETLLSIPFDDYKFRLITFKHDYYMDMTNSYRDKSRKYLKMCGYKLIVSDVSSDGINSCEDWWYNPSVIDNRFVNKFKTNNEIVNIVKYMFID